MTGIGEVLHAAADRIEAADLHRRQADYGRGAGPQVYADLFEAARQRYGWPAVEHLHRYLTRTGHTTKAQLQWWAETDPAAVVKVLRDAAGQRPDADVEVAAVREQMRAMAEELAGALGARSSHVAPETLAREVTRRVRRLEHELAQARVQLETAGAQPGP